MIDVNELGEDSSPPVLSPASRVTFPPLSMLEQGEEYLVGDAASSTFITLPEVGVVAIRTLQGGGTIAQATDAASAFAGEYVDVLDFVGTLVETGLVRSVDGAALHDEAATLTAESWIEGVRPEFVRPFFSSAAWTIYALIAVYCLSLFVVHPSYWPTFHDFFFTSDAAICVISALLVRVALASCHEVCHWLAARAAGVGARFRISRRLYYVVFETDLSQLWSVPARQRFSPCLAGMAFDTVILASCLTVRLLRDAGVIHPPALLVKFLTAVALGQIIGIGWQFLIFLRTDMYAVLVAALGCTNLYRVNQLTIKRRFRHLSAEEERELESATDRDRRAVRWYSWISIAGMIWAAYVFAAIFIPSTLISAVWAFGKLSSVQIFTRPFWEAIVLGIIFSMDFLMPIGIIVRERAHARRERLRARRRSTI